MKKYLICFAISILCLFATLAFGQDMAEAASKGFWVTFLSGMSLPVFFAMLLWSFLGMCVNILTDILRKEKGKKNDPKLTIKSWFEDNWKRAILSTVLIPVAIVMSGEMFGVEMSPLKAFFVGFSSDHLSEIFKKKNFLIKQMKKAE